MIFSSKISESKVTIQYESGNAGKIVCGLITKTSPNPNRARTVDHVTMYVTGDLAWLAAMLGKEDMSSQCCHLCRIFKTEWTEEGHERGEHWSFAKLCEMVDQNQSGKNRMGVKTKPYWDFIPFENYVLPMLHLMIGVGNDIFSYFMDELKKMIP